LTLALTAVAAIVTAQAADKDVLGWESARWGMNENEIKEAFRSKVLVPLNGEQTNETALNIPGYVFLGCPFDVSFRFAGSHGRQVRIEINHVKKFVSHYGNDPTVYETACNLVDRQLEDKLGPPQVRGVEKVWTFASGNVTSGKWQTDQAYVTFAKQLNANEK
jgi:hypothetical protein